MGQRVRSAGALPYQTLTQALHSGEAMAGIASVAAVFLPRVAGLRYRWHTTSAGGFDATDDADPYPG